MIENDNQNSQQAASAAVRNAPNLAKIAQAGVQGGPAGAAAEAAVQYRKEVLVVAIAVMLLPVLVLIMLPGAIFGTLTQPSTAVNDDLEIAANVIQLRNAVSDILQEAYEDTLAEIESERAKAAPTATLMIPWAVMSPTTPFSSFPCTAPIKVRMTIPKSVCPTFLNRYRLTGQNIIPTPSPRKSAPSRCRKRCAGRP